MMKERTEEIIKDYENGLSVIEVKEKYGFSRTSANRYRRIWEKLNGTYNPVKCAREQAFKLFDQGYTNLQVSRIVNRHVNTVAGYRTDWDIKMSKQRATVETKPEYRQKPVAKYWSGCAVFGRKTTGMWRN